MNEQENFLLFFMWLFVDTGTANVAIKKDDMRIKCAF